jgi:hypothetical protein
MADPGVFPDCHCWCHAEPRAKPAPAPEPNPYEAACARFNAAVRNHAIATAEADAMVRAADDEWEAANANLAEYEDRPGIPKPQYREQPVALVRVPLRYGEPQS